MSDSGSASSARLVNPRDLELDHQFWKNPRTTTGLDKSSRKQFAVEVATRGVFVPVLVQRVYNGDGQIHDLVLDGQRRTLGAIAAGLEEIPVIDLSPTPIHLDDVTSTKLMMDVLAAGHHRKGLSTYEESEVAVNLRKQGIEMAAIGKAIGRDASWVSRFLKARGAADDKLLASWRSAKITDEQFKDLASVEPEKQKEALADAVELRGKGRAGKAEARARTKEAKASAKPAKAKKSKKDGRVVKGPQLNLPVVTKGTAKPTSRVMLEEILAMAEKKAPQHDYVKGLMDGVRHALGMLEPSGFAASWRAYLARLPSGPGKAAKTQGKPAKASKSKVGDRKALTAEQRAKKNAADRARRAKA